MVLWISMAALAAAVCLPLLLALRRAPVDGAARAAVDIYRDQLGELDRDVDRGLIRSDEAGAARTEIARRLIHADADTPKAKPGDSRLRNAAAVAIVAMPLAALAVYLALGAPDLPDRPLAARLAAPPEAQDAAALVARVEQQLAARPDDGRGWEVLAPVYIRIGRFSDAAAAYGNALRLLGSTADREYAYGQAVIAANEGRVTPDARAALERARALAPADPRPRFYLAVGLQQDGKTAEAIAAWHALLDGAPPDVAWAVMGRAELARLEAAPAPPAVAGAPAKPPAGAPSGPSAADVAAISNLPADQRAAMIEGMVSSLATRLATESGDANGWAQLIRSYAVLGRPDDARAALVKAKAALVADAAKTALVEDAARSAGLAP